MPALSWVNNEERFYDFECACTVPYPGRLGVVEEGALADLLMVDVNPLENLNLVGDLRGKRRGQL